MSEYASEKDAGAITPAALRREAQRRTVDGYVHIATVRDLMRRLADHMEAMSPYERRNEVSRLLAEDGRPGCPVTVWDGPYSTRCGAGASVGKCAHHGTFASVTPPEGSAR